MRKREIITLEMTDLLEKLDSIDAEKKICLKCNEIASIEDKFCRKCGYPFTAQSKPAIKIKRLDTLM